MKRTLSRLLVITLTFVFAFLPRNREHVGMGVK